MAKLKPKKEWSLDEEREKKGRMFQIQEEHVQTKTAYSWPEAGYREEKSQ